MISFIVMYVAVIASGFQCYLCRGMQSSLDVCDDKIEKAPCSTHAKGADRCGIFSFINGSTGIRVYGKSCVYQRFCEDKEHFCDRVSTKLGQAKNCNILCCTEEFCNFNSSSYKDKYKEEFNGDGNDDDNSEDCDWIDASASVGVSGFLIGVCVLYAITMAKLLI